ncbi:MAG: hypothetical protein HC773_04165 [Scytonema sp. CRU_2_7]|nr:hypothetical protein [Scytonema sp. CRU_2_7]
MQLLDDAAELGAELGAEPAKIHLTILNQPGREELARALEQGQFQVLHYSGHSDLSPAGGMLYLSTARLGLAKF